MALFLAPMEGVIDYQVRQLLTELGGLDGCVTEFVRVTRSALPRRSFLRCAPELAHECHTPNGVPVKLQLLGGDPDWLALNARRAHEWGAGAIDLNFGCPAKTVNRNDGGACLLRQPERLYRIVSAVRQALPPDVPVSAKIRLGYDDAELYLDNALAAAEAGANELTVHARTKRDGYHPPAYWHYITRIREALSIPVIANGEIWNLADFIRCRKETGCEHFMLGRGQLACPDLGRQIRAHCRGEDYQPMGWQQVCQLLHRHYQMSLPNYPLKHSGNRTKQWLMYLQRQYPQAEGFFQAIKRERAPERLESAFLAAA